LATGSYFDALGAKPAAGRFFHAAEDKNEGEPALAVLSYDEWTTHFGGSPDAIGSTIRINGRPLPVIGVAPRRVVGSQVFFRPATGVPRMMRPVMERGPSWLPAGASLKLWVIGRRKAGLPARQAEAISRLSRRTWRAHIRGRTRAW